MIRAHDELSIALQSVGAVAESLPLTGTVALQSAAQRFRADAEEARLRHAGPAEGALAPDDVTGAAGLYVASHHVDHLTNPLVAQVGLDSERAPCYESEATRSGRPPWRRRSIATRSLMRGSSSEGCLGRTTWTTHHPRGAGRPQAAIVGRVEVVGGCRACSRAAE